MPYITGNIGSDNASPWPMLTKIYVVLSFCGITRRKSVNMSVVKIRWIYVARVSSFFRIRYLFRFINKLFIVYSLQKHIICFEFFYIHIYISGGKRVLKRSLTGNFSYFITLGETKCPFGLSKSFVYQQSLIISTQFILWSWKYQSVTSIELVHTMVQIVVWSIISSKSSQFSSCRAISTFQVFHMLDIQGYLNHQGSFILDTLCGYIGLTWPDIRHLGYRDSFQKRLLLCQVNTIPWGNVQTWCWTW